MKLRYNRVKWKDDPSRETPVDAKNLNIMDKGIDDLVDKVNEMSFNFKILVPTLVISTIAMMVICFIAIISQSNEINNYVQETKELRTQLEEEKKKTKAEYDEKWELHGLIDSYCPTLEERLEGTPYE